MLIPEVTAEERESLGKAVSQVSDMNWPIIELLSFFSLSKEKQINILPKLENKQKYCFSEGDFITGNSLAVFLLAYDDCLNSILLRLFSLSDDGFAEIEFIAELRRLVLRSIEGEPEPPWWEKEQDACKSICSLTQISRIRYLSEFFRDLLDLRVSVNEKMMEEVLDSHLHP